ncbi:MAG TPA: DsrE/DsrF/DrsH-like family protein [Acidimicrobiia bacterium]|jgi:peroxiredoxin family protein|nr:DsrE/DsrF/DrsH-like family protein [Acidimicrobiia bacterium]
MTALPLTEHEPPLEEPALRRKRLALVASKGTLDQAYPPLILASTAVSLGWEAGIYFTFYGLDILHAERFDRLKVASLANPAGPIQLPNLLGAIPGATAAATRVMKRWMSNARMPTVPEFIEMSQELGVRFFACSTTMGVMGVTEDDLIPGADIAGAAAFLDYAAEADVSLFI